MANEQKKILIGLDTIFFKVLLSDLLGEAGHAVSFAKDSGRLIEIIKAHGAKIDMLILDMLDANINGYPLLESIKEGALEFRSPVIVITAVSEPASVVQRLRTLGVASMISRSLTPEEIILRINNLLYSNASAMDVPSMRIPVSIPVEFTFDGNKHEGTILNLSDGGAYIYSPLIMGRDAQVGLRFSLPGGRRPMHARGVIKWSPVQSKTGGRGHGVKFTWLSDADANMLKAFVEKERVRYEGPLDA
ncbi:MAG: PilZ domain-containing protein [Deltaproteobacteria bacterium]|nr:PilZ domain-containing protein [Deltaproteobacteria bacterium]